MDNLENIFIEFLKGVGAVGIFIGLIIAYKMGLLDYIKNWRKGNGQEERIVDLEGHAKVANHEMRDVQKKLESIDRKITVIIEDVGFIKGKLSKL